MPTPRTRPDGSETARATGSRRSRLRRLVGPASALTGVTLLVGAARAAGEGSERAGPVAAAGSLLLGVWYREWRAAGGPRPPDIGADEPAPGDADDEFDADTQR